MKEVSLRSIWDNPIHFIACGFGTGAFPIIPGTVGTGVGVLLYLILLKFSLLTYLISTIVLLLLGIYLVGRTNHDLATDDHPAAVWDEIASFPIVMIAIPYKWYFILIGFVLFRIFDVWKPWPIRWIDREIHGGIGVMLDDVVAAVFAWVILYMVTLLLRHFA